MFNYLALGSVILVNYTTSNYINYDFGSVVPARI